MSEHEDLKYLKEDFNKKHPMYSVDDIEYLIWALNHNITNIFPVHVHVNVSLHGYHPWPDSGSEVMISFSLPNGSKFSGVESLLYNTKQEFIDDVNAIIHSNNFTGFQSTVGYITSRKGFYK